MMNREQKLRMRNGNPLSNTAWIRKPGVMRDTTLLENERCITRNYSYTDNKTGELKDSWEYYICNKTDYLNLIVDNPNCNLCEYITTSKRKLYFDYDIKEPLPAINRERANEVLKMLVKNINEHFNINITVNDVIVFARDKQEIRSLHFIIPKYSTTAENLLIFIGILKEQDKYFDDRVYQRRKAFCLKYQSKVRTENPIERHFKSFNSVSERLSENVNNYLIVETDKTKYVELSSETHQMVFDKAVESKMEEIKLDEQEEQKSNNIVSYMLSHKVNKNDIVQVFLDTLPNDYFSNWGHNPKWKYTTKILNSIGANEIDLWLKESAIKSNNNFTEGQNKQWFNSISETDEWVHFNANPTVIKNHLETIKKTFNIDYSYTRNVNAIMDTPLLRQWLVKETGKSKIEIANIFNDKNIIRNDENSLSIGKDYKLWLSTLTLEKPDRQRNFYIETFKNLIEFNKNNFLVMDRDTLTDAFEKDLNDSTIKHIGINAKWGMRKTSLYINKSIHHINKLSNQPKVMIPTEGNSLNLETYTKLSKEFPNLKIMTHQKLLDQKLKRFPSDTNIIICSMESILKCDTTIEYDLVIFDEFESMVLHLESPTMSTEKIEPHLYLNKMKECGIRCKKIICLDADLTFERQQPLLENLGINEDASKCYYMTDNKWLEYTFNVFVNNESAFWEDMEKNIKDDKRVAVATLSAQKIITINKSIELLKKEKIIKSTKNVLVSTSEGDNGIGWKYNGVCLSKVAKRDGNGFYSVEEVRENVSAFILDMEVDYWLYSPTIKCGISFDEDNYFDVVYGKSNNFSCVAREFIQMLFRVREVKEKVINIHIDMFHIPKTLPTDEQFKNRLTKNMCLPYYQLSKDEKDIDWVKLSESIKLCPLYEKWKIINWKEKWLSQNNLPHEICRLLSHNHGLKLNFIHREENLEIKEKLKDCRELVKSENINLITATELLQPNDFSLKSKYNKPSPLDYQKLKKRKLINKLGKYTRKETYDKKILDLDIHDAHEEWVKESDFDFIENNYIKQPLEIIDINNLWGYEYYTEKIEKEDEEDIWGEPTNNYTRFKKRIWTYADIFHDNYNAVEKILNPPAELNHINYNNGKPLPTDEKIHCDINDNLTNENKWKMYFKFLSRFAPFVFEDYQKEFETTTINLTEFKLSVKDFKLSMVKNEEWIKTEMNDFMLIVKNKLNDRDWSKFNATKSKDRKDFYSIFKSALGYYGFNIHAPDHKECNKQCYKIKPVPKLYYNKPHKPIDYVPLTMDSETHKDYFSINKSSQIIKTNSNKKQRNYFDKTYHEDKQKSYSEVYGKKSIQLFNRSGGLWEEEYGPLNKIVDEKKQYIISNQNILEVYGPPNKILDDDNKKYHCVGDSTNLKNYTYREIKTDNVVKVPDDKILTQIYKTIIRPQMESSSIKNKDMDFLKFFLRYKPNTKKNLSADEYEEMTLLNTNSLPKGVCVITEIEATDTEHPSLSEYYKECSNYYNTYKQETIDNKPHCGELPDRPNIEFIEDTSQKIKSNIWSNELLKELKISIASFE